MSNKPEVFDKNTLEQTENKLQDMMDKGSLDLPPNYSWSNALHAAWLQLQDTTDKNNNPVWKTCTKASVMKGLIEMVMQGLNPSKDQIYPIAYGDKLVMQRSNFGDEALLRRLYDVGDVDAQLVYEGDEIDYEIKEGRITIKEHNQSLKNRLNNKIVAAYATIKFADQDNYTEIMGIEEIENAWAQRRGSDKSKAHKNFEGEMAKKTVISRDCERYINSSDDSVVLSGVEDLSIDGAKKQQIEAEKAEKANKEVIDIEEEPDEGEPEPEEENVEEDADEPEETDGNEDDELVPPGQREDNPLK